jgi:hypothetical protein
MGRSMVGTRAIPSGARLGFGYGAAMALDHLADTAEILLVPADPPLDAARWGRLEGALGKLFAQFAREGRTSAWGVELVAGGAIVAIAWEGSGQLSGCGRDTLTRLLLAQEVDGQRLIGAPPLVVEVAGAARCCDRASLRALAASGAVGATTPAYDLRVADLGSWRVRGRRPLAETAAGRLIAV